MLFVPEKHASPVGSGRLTTPNGGPRSTEWLSQPGTREPPPQSPLRQVVLTMQGSPSSQLALLSLCTQVPATQVSFMHGSWSSHRLSFGIKTQPDAPHESTVH